MDINPSLEFDTETKSPAQHFMHEVASVEDIGLTEKVIKAENF